RSVPLDGADRRPSLPRTSFHHLLDGSKQWSCVCPPRILQRRAGGMRLRHRPARSLLVGGATTGIGLTADEREAELSEDEKRARQVIRRDMRDDPVV
ncbi:MAG TPA: hypothetical protein VE673_09970, partial [Pseudonocardiaceae bacterium]|nr:hypothetical protein [Pseudonocardiaceae bacterium]